MSRRNVVESKSKKLLKELSDSQLENVLTERKLRYKDLCRIVKYIETSPFDEDECCLWKGYVTNVGNVSKGTYINFYFREHKVALHRLLYDNFVEHVEDNEYLKFSCTNRGKCCNVHHMIKYKYNHNTSNEDSDSEESVKKKKVQKKKNLVKKRSDSTDSEPDPKMFTISFD